MSLSGTSDDAFVMEWTIPAGADGNGGLGTTIKLPIVFMTEENNYTVDWGDGTTNTYTTETFPTHTYNNTEEKTYTISITGTVRSFGNRYRTIPTATNTYSDYYTFTTYLTKIVSWGEIGAKGNHVHSGGAANDNILNNIVGYGFSNCKNLIGPIPTPTENSFKDITNFEMLFYGCSKLNDTIPETLFASAKNVECFYRVFSGCKALSGTIPENLFVNNVDATDFSYIFENCSGLTEAIPENLFAKNVNAKEFEHTFSYCSGLTSSFININTKKMTSNYGMFAECTNVKYLLLNNKFDKIQSGKGSYSYQNCVFAEANTSIITMRTEPIQFLKCSSYDQYCPATLYVKNSTTNPTIEQNFEVADTEGMFKNDGTGNLNSDRIKPVIELIGEKTVTIGIGLKYQDLGVNVAGYPSADLEEYPELGLTLEVDTSAVDNALKNRQMGTYTVTYTLKHNGTPFSIETRTVIVKEELDISKATITLNPKTYTYAGKGIEAKPVITLEGRTLEENTDYILSYTNNINVGTAKVTATGKGTYQGSISIKFSITPFEIEIEWNPQSKFNYTGSVILPTLKKEVLDGANGEKIYLKVRLQNGGESINVGKYVAEAYIDKVEGGTAGASIANYVIAK